MNLFQEAKEVLDKSGKVNPLGPYGRQKLTGREVSTYFRRNKVKDAKLRKAVEVALDLGGAMSVAQREIKKFYGDKIANSPEVKSALKYANESVEFTLDTISEDEIKVDHENPKDRADQKKFRKIIQLGKQAKIKLLDGGGRGYRAQGNKSQVQKFKQLVSKEFGKSVSFSEDAEEKAKLALKHAQDRKRLKDQQKSEKERLNMGEALTNMPEPVQNQLSRLRNKRMDVKYGSPEYVRIGKQIDQIMSRYAKKLNNEVEKVKENKKFNEFDTVRKMWEDALEKKNLKESNLKEVSLDNNMMQRHFANVWATKDAKIYRVLAQLVNQDGFVDNRKAYQKNPKDYLNRLRDIAKNPKKYEKSFGRNFAQYINNPKPGQNYAKLPESLEEQSMGDKIGMLFKTKDKKEIDGIANLMNMTSVKVLQSMMRQNPKGFKRMAKKMGELPAMEEKEILNSFELNEVTDKEINMAKKLSKDMEKVKKGYQQIAKTGDKTLKSTGFNATYESILKAQQKVLSLIGELTTMKQISDRGASRKKDAQGRPIMSSNIMDSYREMREDELKEESITYQLKIKNKNGPEYKKFEKSARMMKLKMSSKMNAGNKLVAVLNGTKKNLRDFDAVVRGRQSYGDPSTVKHFDEK